MLRTLRHGGHTISTSKTPRWGLSAPSLRKALGTGVKQRALKTAPRINTIQKASSPWHDILYDSTYGDTKNIVIDNLKATVDVHRASNSKSFIRKTPSAPLGWEARSRKDIASIIGENDHTQVLPEWYPKHLDPSIYTELEARVSLQGLWRGPEQESPWLAHMKPCNGDGLRRLGEEINAFTQYMTPTKMEDIAIGKVVKRIQFYARADDVSLHARRCLTFVANPLQRIEMALYSKSSPKSPLQSVLDLTFKASWRGKDLHEVATKIETLYSSMLSKHVFFRTNVFGQEYIDGRGSKPKTFRSFYAIDSDTFVQVKVFPTGIETLGKYKSFVHYTSEFPGLQSLFTLLDHALYIRNMDKDPALKSARHALFLLYYTALKLSPRALDRTDAVGQLLQVLDFCANMDTRKYEYCLHSPQQVRPKTQEPFPMTGDKGLHANFLRLRGPCPSHTFDWSIRLLNPFTDSEKLSAKLWQIRHIQCFFAQAKHEIQRRMQKWEQMSKEKREEWDEGILDPLVKADYTEFESSRKRLQRTGRS